MNRTRGILAAGTLTGLVIITLLALGFGNLRAAGGGETAVSAPNTATIELPTPDTAIQGNEEALQAWQQYSAELEQTVRTMQEREAAYQTQLDAANQTILQLQNDINSANSAPVHYDDDDRYEHEEHEDEDDDHEEHEEYDDD